MRVNGSGNGYRTGKACDHALASVLEGSQYIPCAREFKRHDGGASGGSRTEAKAVGRRGGLRKVSSGVGDCLLGPNAARLRCSATGARGTYRRFLEQYQGEFSSSVGHATLSVASEPATVEVVDA